MACQPSWVILRKSYSCRIVVIIIARRDTEVQTFIKNICPKVYLIARLDIELIYNDMAV